MARRRGLSDQERLGLDIAGTTATGQLFGGPCFVYSIDASQSDTTTSGTFIIGDTTGTADLATDGHYMKFTMAASVSGGEGNLQRNFNPPLFISKALFIQSSTGVQAVSVSYIAGF